MLGDIANQLGMFIMVLVFVRPSGDPCPEDGDISAEIVDMQRALWWQLLALHFFATIIMLGRERNKDLSLWYHVWSNGFTVISIVQLSILSELLQYFAKKEQFRDVSLDKSYFRFNEWILVEILYVPAIMFINMMYLFFRCFLDQKLTVKMSTLLLNEEADFIIVNSVTLRIMTNTFVPALTTIIVVLRLPSDDVE